MQQSIHDELAGQKIGPQSVGIEQAPQEIGLGMGMGR
jgi:hypothetical protein